MIHAHKMSSDAELVRDPVCLFRVPAKGGRAIWEITNICNYQCIYCIFSAKRGKIKGELSTDEAKTVIDGLKAYGFTHIKYTGGEPFVRKDLLEIMRYSDEKGFYIDVSTNASIITDDIATDLAKLKNLTMVHVSVDGHNSGVNDSVRGTGTYDRTMAGLAKLERTKIYTRIGTVIFKGNEDHLEEIVQSVIGANEIIFSFMEPEGRMKGDQAMIARTISEKPVEQTKAEILQLAEKYAGQIVVKYSLAEPPREAKEGVCPGASRFIYINNFGVMYPCTWIAAQNPEFGSAETIKTASFEELMDYGPLDVYRRFINTRMMQGVHDCPVRRR
jgi:MoaA/NifB/PqqE/SkfB family radical SAM enzyme